MKRSTYFVKTCTLMSIKKKYHKLKRANVHWILDTSNMYQVLKEKNRSKEDIISAFKFLITLTGAHGFYIIIQSQL